MRSKTGGQFSQSKPRRGLSLDEDFDFDFDRDDTREETGRPKTLKGVFLRVFGKALYYTAGVVVAAVLVMLIWKEVLDAQAATKATRSVNISKESEMAADDSVVATDLVLKDEFQMEELKAEVVTQQSQQLTYLDIAEEDMNFHIDVNHIWNTVTVYTEYFPGSGEFDQPYKVFTVSVGTGDNTKIGVYTVGNNGKSDWRYEWQKMEGNSWTQYDIRFEGSRLFHSPVYSSKGAYNTMSTSMFNNLGQAASHGCIRMRTGDAYWMYTHIKEGTTVRIYNDITSPGPLGKPVIQRITDACPTPYRTWDPTDPNPDNPWLTATEEQLALWLEDAVYQDPVTIEPTPGITAEAKPIYLVLNSDDGILHLPLNPPYAVTKSNFACYYGDDSSPANWNLYFDGPHDLETPGIYYVQAYAMDVATEVKSAPISVTIQVEVAQTEE